MKRKIVIEIACLSFILLFVYAGVAKLLDVEKFRIQIGQSPLLTDIAGFIAWFIPGTEICVSIMLISSRFRLAGLLGAFGLMVLFTAYIISILQFSDYIPCSCGGVLQSLGWAEHLLFNILFILIAVVGIVLQSREQKVIKQTAYQ